MQLVSEHLLHILSGTAVLAAFLFGTLQVFVYLDRRGKKKNSKYEKRKIQAENIVRNRKKKRRAR